MVPEIWSTLDIFLILNHFLPFYPTNNPKNQNFEKKHLQISFYTSVSKIMIICYIAPKIWHVADVIFVFHSELFFTLLPLTAQKFKKFFKMKKYLEVTSFYICVPKIMIRSCKVPEMKRQTDQLKK